MRIRRWSVFGIGLILLASSGPAARAENAIPGNFDVVVVGGTPGGIASALSAARQGRSVALVEYHDHIGGMAASGLGMSDIENRSMIGGLFKEFVQRVFAHYVKTYGAQSENVKLCHEGYVYEPSVAEAVFESLLREQKSIAVFKGWRLKSATVVKNRFFNLPAFSGYDHEAKAATKDDHKKDIAKENRSKSVSFAGKDAGNGKAVRLFILSGQSNMAGLDHKKFFIPVIETAFPEDELIFVKDAQSGQPIRRWAANWKPVGDWKGKSIRDKPGNNDLYKRLMASVRSAVQGKKLDSVSFVWMQGEADAKQGQASNYGDALRGLIQQVRDDMGRKDVFVVLGRLSDHLKGDKNWDLVRETQVKVAKEVPLVEWVDTDDLNGANDGLHYAGDGYRKLGNRFAQKAIELIKKQANEK